ncbi:MAG: hypothetical protein R2867_37875 [Caldilineaceae bacterium]
MISHQLDGAHPNVVSTNWWLQYAAGTIGLNLRDGFATSDVNAATTALCPR